MTCFDCQATSTDQIIITIFGFFRVLSDSVCHFVFLFVVCLFFVSFRSDYTNADNSNDNSKLVGSYASRGLSSELTSLWGNVCRCRMWPAHRPIITTPCLHRSLGTELKKQSHSNILPLWFIHFKWLILHGPPQFSGNRVTFSRDISSITL